MINAIDAVGEEHGKILIRIAEAAEFTVSIEISDNGPGVASDDEQHLFDPFFLPRK